MPVDSELDIGYQYIVPVFEENPDPNKQATMEFYFSEYDGSENSKRKLEFLKELLENDKRAAKDFGMESVAIGPHNFNIEDSEQIDQIAESLELNDISYQNIHEGFDFKLESEKSQKREPNSVLNPRTYWSLVRFATSSGGIYATLVFMQGVSPTVAAVVSALPGLASGAVTYYSGGFGNWLTNGKWAKWLVESDQYFARTLRKGFGLTPKSFEQSLIKNKKIFQKKYPNLYEKMPEYFEARAKNEAAEAASKSKLRLSTLAKKLQSADEYLKWWVTEVLFTSVAIKAPQSIAGIGAATTLLQGTADVLIGSTMAVVAQGPADIAIQLRKFQKVEELGEAIKLGKIEDSVAEIVVNGKKVQKKLSEEVKMVLAKTGEFQSYSITNHSHRALQKIENWARSRSTLISFFSVAGVAMDIAKVPLGKPILVGLGIGGGVYYTHVKGMFKLNAAARFKNLIAPFKKDAIMFNMRSLFSRFCHSKFLKI